MVRSWLAGVVVASVSLGWGCIPQQSSYQPPGGAGGGGGGSSVSVSGVGGAPAPASMCAGASAGASGTMLRPPAIQPTIGASVVRAATPPPPLSGGTLLVLADGSAAIAADPERDLISVVDLATRTVRAQIPLEPGDEPGRVTEDGAGRVHVALRRGGAVVAIDPVAGTVVSRRGVCAAPRGLAYEPSTALVHVACAGGELVSLPAAGGDAARTLMLEPDLRDVVVSGPSLMVSTFRRAEVLVLDAAGAVTNRMRPPVLQQAGPTGTQMLSPSVAWRMQPLAGGGAVMAHQRGMDGPITTDGGGYAGGGRCGGVVGSTVSVMVPGQVPVVAAPSLALNVLPIDVAVSSDGKNLLVASAGNFGLPSGQQVMATTVSAMSSPNPSPCIPGTGPSVVVGQVVAVAFTSSATPNWVAQTREPAALIFGDGANPVTLAADSRQDTGHLVFHVNAGGAIACASCHPEGGEDGRVWDFACLGARRTQSLRGGLSGTEPFHWDGDMKDFPQLVHEVFEGRMLGPVLSTEQSGALLGWIDTIRALPARPADAASERGRALFDDPAVACGSCHAGPHLTNNGSFDVGTGRVLQVPSLRGVRWRAPYLHAGCAPTLADRFGACGGGDRHGHTSQLLPADVADLTAYLETL